MDQKEFSLKTWKTHDLHPKEMNEKSLDWYFTNKSPLINVRIFVIDTMNFSFWAKDVLFTVPYKGKNYTGYWALCAAINRAIDVNRSHA